MTNASQAAAAALSNYNRNQQSQGNQYQPSLQAYQASGRASGRANSLSGYGQRSNSMRSYTYTPKPSYQPSTPANRSYSLRSNSLRGAPPARTSSLTQKPVSLPQRTAAPRTSSLTQRNQQLPRINSLNQNYPSQRAGSFTGANRGLNSLTHEEFNEEDENFDGEEVIITTKTTKVVDSLGRTRLITTETIRQLPDGSNVVETTTKNISRPTSRSNSFRNNSMTLQGNPLYNLNKIDEDLQDFDYNYLDHPSSKPPQLNSGIPESQNEEQHPVQPAHLAPAFDAPRRSLESGLQAPSGPRARNDNSISPSSSSSPRLKSILKHSPGMADAQPYEAEPEKVNNFYGVREDAFKDAHDLLQENRRHFSRGGMNSSASRSNSIKFVEQVETIPYEVPAPNPEELARAEALEKEREKQNSIQMYEQAMQVAMAKVYGSPQGVPLTLTPPQSPPTPSAVSPQVNVEELADKKIKNDHKKLKDEGIRKNYVYENHHKNFAMHSLRGDEEPGHSSRSERAKEEKKRQKEEEKARAELIRLTEKDKKEKEKEDGKRNRKAPKNPLSFLGIKMRRGSSGSMGSGVSGRRSEKLNEEGLQFSSESGNRLAADHPETQAEAVSPVQNSYNERSAVPQMDSQYPQQQAGFANPYNQRAAESPVITQAPQQQAHIPQQQAQAPQQQAYVPQQPAYIPPQQSHVPSTFNERSTGTPFGAQSTQPQQVPSEYVERSTEVPVVAQAPQQSTATPHADEEPVQAATQTPQEPEINHLNYGEEEPALEAPRRLQESYEDVPVVDQSDVPPRSALRNSHIEEAELALFERQPTSAEDAFHDSNDDFIDVPEEYLDEGKTGNTLRLDDRVEHFKVVNRSAAPQTPVPQTPVQQPHFAATQVSPTQPIPPSVVVPEDPTPVIPLDTSIYADSKEERFVSEPSASHATELPTLVSGDNGHPVVLGSGSANTSGANYSTLDPGSPVSAKRKIPADLETEHKPIVPSDKSAVSVEVALNDKLAERAQVNPEIATTSAGALEPSAAAETQFNPEQRISVLGSETGYAQTSQNFRKESTQHQNAAGSGGPVTHEPLRESAGFGSSTEDAVNVGQADANNGLAYNGESELAASSDHTEGLVDPPVAETEKTKRKKGRGFKFRKMIDKYFVSSYGCPAK